MRYTILALALVAFACSKKESPPKTAEATESQPVSKTEAVSPGTENPPEATQLAPEPAPIVKLITAGNPPLEKVRRGFEVGAKEVLEMKDEHTITMKGGGWANEYFPPAIVQTIIVETKAVSADGIAEVALEVSKVDKIETSAGPPNATPMDTTGVTGTYRVNSLGVISGLKLTPPLGGKVKSENLDMVRDQLRWMAPPFPEEAIGIGAKWTVAGVVNQYQTQMKEHIEVELLELTDSDIVLRFEIKSSGSLRHDHLAPPQSIALVTDARGRAKLDRNRLVPRSSTLEGDWLQTVRSIGVDEPPDGPLKMKHIGTISFKELSK